MIPDLVLIDDDPILLIILEKMFRKINPKLTIQSFESGLDGLEFLKNQDSAHKPIAMVDVNLKDISAWDFLDKLESSPSSVPPIFLITSSVNSKIPEISREYKCVAGFYVKPITLETIKKINHQILEVS
ncbi:response regulator [Algoriphagus confluentis]|uniref:Response regulatory domain-containing protein n=1 Tax=Algoriphagus confluentis TaxID=1697556 RepID=A0ABQ6PQX2_9BACT|nr:hypothetical protein Aconfl_22980 [Algoriphagus confluentis]